MSRNIWFTSDLHLSHANIIKYSKRPFTDVDEMNEKLIEGWNSRVKPGDTVYLLGDVFFGPVRTQDDVLDRLQGKITLISGNRDTGLVNRMIKKGNRRFEKIAYYHELRDGKDFFVMCHYPFAYWNRSHHGSYNLHGHSHGGLEPQSKRKGLRRLDVGVDVHNYVPIDLSEVRAILKDRPWNHYHHTANTETMETLPAEFD